MEIFHISQWWQLYKFYRILVIINSVFLSSFYKPAAAKNKHRDHYDEFVSLVFLTLRLCKSCRWHTNVFLSYVFFCILEHNKRNNCYIGWDHWLYNHVGACVNYNLIHRDHKKVILWSFLVYPQPIHCFLHWTCYTWCRVSIQILAFCLYYYKVVPEM